MADNIHRVESDDDLNRCQGVTAQGQCPNKALEGATFCQIHGGVPQKRSQENKSLRNYRLSKWQARLEDKAESPQIKSLRDEIGVLRMLLEERLNQCRTETDLILYSQPIADLVIKVEHVVSSCHKLEEKLNIVVDRQQLLQFASIVIDILSHHLDEDRLQDVSNKILVAIGKVGQDDN